MITSRLRRFAHGALADLEGDIDRIEDWLSRGEGHDKKVGVAGFAGYRNDTTLRLKARVVRHSMPADPGERFLPRLRAMMALYNSRELPGIPVRLEAHGQVQELVSDDEGYVDFELPVDVPLPEKTCWEEVILTTPGREAQEARIKVPVMAPARDGHWGIISDIDDTVVETGATDFLKNWRRVLVERPSDRQAVPGASELYGMIAEDHVAPARPFFYVSSSPWNLHAFIAEFMQLNGIPHGPMFLKDYGIDRERLGGGGHGEHKLAAIETILAFYPGFRFLLIGDNGQEDVSIYAQVVEHFGPRVAGVFIRDVEGSCRSGAKGELIAAIERAGVPTYCGTGFQDAVAVVKSLDFDRPLEAAKAMVEPAEKA